MVPHEAEGKEGTSGDMDTIGLNIILVHENIKG